MRTSSRTALMYGPSLGSVSRSASRSSAFRIGRPARISVTNCWLKIRNFSRLSFLAARQQAGRLRRHARLDRIDQEALLRVPVAQFLFGGGRGHLLVDLPAAVGVLEDELGHGLLLLPPPPSAPAGGLNWNSLASSGGSTFSWSKWNVQNRVVEPGHLHLPNAEVRRHQELHRRIRQVVGFRFGGDPRAAAVRRAPASCGTPFQSSAYPAGRRAARACPRFPGASSSRPGCRPEYTATGSCRRRRTACPWAGGTPTACAPACAA